MPSQIPVSNLEQHTIPPCVDNEVPQIMAHGDTRSRARASAFNLETPRPAQLLSLAVDVLHRFRHDGSIMAIPVIGELLQPVGLITRRKALAVFGHKYSYERNSRKTVEILMPRLPGTCAPQWPALAPS